MNGLLLTESPLLLLLLTSFVEAKALAADAFGAEEDDAAAPGARCFLPLRRINAHY